MEEGLPVMEVFYTLQGEGQYCGTPALFIRLAGCDVGCVWCDVKVSWDASKHSIWSYEKLENEIKNCAANIVVVTGGEPLLYNLDRLTQIIKKCNKRTHIETSGSSELSGTWDWICVSPKKFKAPIKEIITVSNELKTIIYNASDFAFAQSFESIISSDCQKYIQVEWSKKDHLKNEVLEFLYKNPAWKLSIQTHKYIGID